MIWPAWLSLTSPLKFSVWLLNRLATWTGLLYLWRRWRSRRHAWVWLTLVNLVSLGGLCLALFWLYRRSAPR